MEAQVKNDYTKAWRVRSGHTRQLLVSTATLRDLVSGVDRDARSVVLSDALGPKTAHAILEDLPTEEM